MRPDTTQFLVIALNQKGFDFAFLLIFTGLLCLTAVLVLLINRWSSR